MRESARLRLTCAFALGVFLIGGAIVVTVFLVMRYLPDYQIASGSVAPAFGPSGAPPLPLPTGTSVEEAQSSKELLEAMTGGVPAVTVSTESDLLHVLLVTSCAVFAATTIVGVAMCWRLAGRVLRPVEGLVAAVAYAEHGAGRRIAVREPVDEFGRLAVTLNEMFDRLDRSFAAQQRFAANASHELRTPLATNQAMLDVALAEPETVDITSLATRLRETNDRSIGTVQSLLELADAQSGASVRGPVDVAFLVGDTVAEIQDEAAARGIRIALDSKPCPISGDDALIRSMISNVITNAVRHNVDGGWVGVSVECRSVRVQNTGATIHADNVARLTEPFFRVAGRVAGSHGIGLTLVEAVVAAHGASLSMQGRDSGGLDVEVVFPEE